MPGHAGEVSAGRTAARELAERIRASILDGSLAPGSPLREEALAARHKLSRHTVRSALALVAADRLVRIEPYRGAFVSALDDAELVGLQQLRAALESEAVRLIEQVCQSRGGSGVERAGVPGVTGVAEARMADALRDAYWAAAELADLERRGAPWPQVARAHSLVHRALVAAAGSARILAAYEQLDAEILLLLLHLRPHESAGRLGAEHLAYLDAVCAGESGAVHAHLEQATAAILATRAHPPA